MICQQTRALSHILHFYMQIFECSSVNIIAMLFIRWTTKLIPTLMKNFFHTDIKWHSQNMDTSVLKVWLLLIDIFSFLNNQSCDSCCSTRNHLITFLLFFGLLLWEITFIGSFLVSKLWSLQILIWFLFKAGCSSITWRLLLMLLLHHFVSIISIWFIIRSTFATVSMVVIVEVLSVLVMFIFTSIIIIITLFIMLLLNGTRILLHKLLFKLVAHLYAAVLNNWIRIVAI